MLLSVPLWERNPHVSSLEKANSLPNVSMNSRSNSWVHERMVTVWPRRDASPQGDELTSVPHARHTGETVAMWGAACEDGRLNAEIRLPHHAFFDVGAG
jgi:hypothetical protein